MNEIEAYLHRIADLLPAPDPDRGLLSVLEPILAVDSETATTLRAALGFPRSFARAQRLYELVASDEPCMQPVLGSFSQRIHLLMWRYGYTLIEIHADWAKPAKAASEAISDLCDQRLVIRQPTLLDFSGSADVEDRLKAVAEPAPDPALFAALRDRSCRAFLAAGRR